MKVSFTERIEIRYSVLFAIVVFAVQQLEHTDLTFSALFFCFIIISNVAYNAARGLIYPSGAFVFFNATLTVIFGLTYKLFLGEPGESNLQVPNEAMLAYCALMAVTAFCAALSHRVRPKRVLLPQIDYPTMRYAAMGCLLVGSIVQFISWRNLGQAGTISTALHQLNYLPTMAIIFATVYQMDKSGGKSSTNWIVWLAGAVIFFYGIIGFSKEGLFAPFVTWILTALLYGFKFRWKQVTVLIVFGIIAQLVLIPFSQYGRRSRATQSGVEFSTAQIALAYLTHPLETRALYLEDVQSVGLDANPHLYSSPQGFVDRLNMICFDDALMAETDRNNVFGLFPTYAAYLNVIPHFIWANKPDAAFGNTYAHEIGLLGDDDSSTGVSFSPVGDAYHEAKWFGILAVWPVVIFLYFFVTDSLTGNVRQSPYAVLPIALAAHAAPEGMMSTPIYLQTTGAMLLIIIAFMSKSVLAYAMRVTMGGERVRVLRTRDFILSETLARTKSAQPQPPSETKPA